MNRRSRRHVVSFPAVVKTSLDGSPAPAHVGNLSAEGLLLERLTHPLATESDIWIEIPKGEGRARVGLVGRVAWTTEDRAGIVIEAMLPHHRQRLWTLLEHLS